MILSVAVASAQKRHTVVFYNVENFFDTINDPDINDAYCGGSVRRCATIRR